MLISNIVKLHFPSFVLEITHLASSLRGCIRLFADVNFFALVFVYFLSNAGLSERDLYLTYMTVSG